MVSIDRTTLAPLVRQATRIETAEVGDWRCAAVRGGLMGARVYRLSGTASDGGSMVPWAVMLKMVRCDRGQSHSTEPSIRCLAELDGDVQSEDLVETGWRREPLAFALGLLNELPGGLAAPRCFGVVERSSDEVWIWLEEIQGQLGTEWSRERIVLGARHLGQFNGAYMAGGRLPSAPWLLRGMLRRWIAHLSLSVEQLLAALDHGHPLLRRGWPADVADALNEVWTERDVLCDALDRLPRTFCHHDANGRNLIARTSTHDRDQTVVIDWDFVGIGPPGYDIVPLCGELLPSFQFELTEAQDVVEDLFEGYLAGLRDAGWQGDRGRVRLSFTSALALRYGVCGGPANLYDLLDDSRHWVPEQRWGRSITEVMDRWAGCSRFMLGLADEARELLHRLS